ncbi:2-polyprenyl-6-methoxyphenol hydroxylase-like FAD-dependent oxidoreductase [Kibdelosporangium banguiense]|uniref:2-polyprenyl-6-methoxyphenol hydroxylase-like FAD-dependent oxidoreductase n=1 Tax=Kibdelosporangium banguiense TaxID=1365924 RepID=A0ABS4TF08_9PSEU|nr:FAD-dependent monooxygenase [Kibdelosporangium banguiense]MBP2322995.1 2-polyprenyl-6-methoxyphenol hydroxylase-like FAD-dependent oxidoreductase [Kibdelosporangium banguiense]
MIVIAGGGPNGLLLASELAQAGVRPIVLEQLAERSTEPKANGMVGQVVRLLDHRGLHERLGGGRVPFKAPMFMFGAMPLNLSALEVNPVTILPVPQRRLEQVLEERAVELGAEVRRGHRVVSFTQDDDGVTIAISGPDGDYTERARYLVGADGAHSVVRKQAGIDFPGVTTVDTVARAAHVTMPERVDGRLDVPGFGRIASASFTRTDRGLFVWAELEPGRPLMTTVEWDSAPGDEVPMTIDELRASVHRVLGADVPIGPPASPGPHVLRRLTGGNTRLAEKYRAGRVFLVGDAAHVHSSMGGPGLNLGLQDAANLGWKLAAQVRGWAPEGLLGTYESERRPVAERVVMHTQAQSALTAPGGEVTALRELFGELLTNVDTVRHIAETMAGSDIRYEMRTTHPLAGKFLPDIELSDGSRVAELMYDARPTLLDFTGSAALADLAAGWSDRVDLVAVQSGRPPADVILVRPDGYVAWAGDTVLSGLNEEMAMWFGIPRTAAMAT